MSEGIYNGLLSEETTENNGLFKVYWYRWLQMLLFVVSGVSNAMILLSWSPITDKANQYWNNIGLTAINLLNVIFQIMYLPGTLLALRISQTYDLKAFLLFGGTLTSVGCLIRLLGALADDVGSGSAGSYTLVLLGTSLVGLAQPFYLNLPAKIATTWFAINERDIATTLCSLANPLGSAIGSFIPPLFVTSDSDHQISTGIRTLLVVQLLISTATLFLVFCFFKDKPPTPPSQSTTNTQQQPNSNIFKEIKNLFVKVEYVKLFFSFTLILGHLNALAALLNQLPGGYSNDQIGSTGAVLIISGFVGALTTGFVLEYTKAYRTVLKLSYVAAFVCWTFFLSNCKSNNFPLFIFGAAILGFSTLPTSKLSIYFIFFLHQTIK
jgi:hypothetical protein